MVSACPIWSAPNSPTTWHASAELDICIPLVMAQERAEGFVEGVEAARALTPATIEGLFVAVEDVAARRRRELAP